MITIRKNVFETNSSSEHTLVLSPVENATDLDEETAHTKRHLRLNIKNGAYVVDPDRIVSLDFGEFITFEDKFIFVLVLMLLSKTCGKRLMTASMWERDEFSIKKANKIFNVVHKSFVKKFCKWANEMSGKECDRIEIGNYSEHLEKEIKKCGFNLNHQALYTANDEENYGLKADPLTVITTFGMNILYEFC